MCFGVVKASFTENNLKRLKFSEFNYCLEYNIFKKQKFKKDPVIEKLECEVVRNVVNIVKIVFICAWCIIISNLMRTRADGGIGRC